MDIHHGYEVSRTVAATDPRIDYEKYTSLVYDPSRCLPVRVVLT